MAMTGSNAAAALLALTLSMGAAGAQDAETGQDDGNVTRTWEIYLASGEVIEFRGQGNWAGTNKGPSQFLADYQAVLSGGELPRIARYSFPATAGTTDRVADIVIDLSKVVAVVQKF